MNDNGHAPYSDVHSRAVWRQFTATTPSTETVQHRKILRVVRFARPLLFWSLALLAFGLCISEFAEGPALKALAQLR